MRLRWCQWRMSNSSVFDWIIIFSFRNSKSISETTCISVSGHRVLKKSNLSISYLHQTFLISQAKFGSHFSDIFFIFMGGEGKFDEINNRGPEMSSLECEDDENKICNINLATWQAIEAFIWGRYVKFCFQKIANWLRCFRIEPSV